MLTALVGTNILFNFVSKVMNWILNENWEKVPIFDESIFEQLYWTVFLGIRKTDGLFWNVFYRKSTSICKPLRIRAPEVLPTVLPPLQRIPETETGEMEWCPRWLLRPKSCTRPKCFASTRIDLNQGTKQSSWNKSGSILGFSNYIDLKIKLVS